MNRCPYHQTSHITGFDALDHEARANPWPYYDWLRQSDERRVYALPDERDFFVIHRYEDVKTVLSDPITFSSKIIPTKKSLFFVLMDGDEHKRIRSLAGELFNQKRLHEFNRELERFISTAAAELISGKPTELFSAWADKIPLGTLSILFGLDPSPENLGKLHHDNIAINKALFVIGGTGPRRKASPGVIEKASITFSLLRNAGKLIRLRQLLGAKGMSELMDMLIPAKGNHQLPRPDFKSMPEAVGPFISLLITFASLLQKDNGTKSVLPVLREAIKNGEATLTEMTLACAFIIFAGYETTSSLLSNCYVHLANHPEQFRYLKSHPEKIDDFIEESLRYYTPVGRFLRKTTTDTVMHGTKIPKGSIVIVLNGAANTDPDKFAEGCAFDSGRSNASQHLSFGKGPHFCIGAPLALFQVRLALRELIGKAGNISVLDPDQLKMVTDRDNGILRYEKIMAVAG